MGQRLSWDSALSGWGCLACDAGCSPPEHQGAAWAAGWPAERTTGGPHSAWPRRWTRRRSLPSWCRGMSGGLRQQRATFQPLGLEALEQLHLMPLVAAGEQDEELLGDCGDVARRLGDGRRRKDGIGGGLPGGL